MSRALSASCTDTTLIVDLDDGRRLSEPLRDVPQLLAATPEQRAKVRISPAGLHWDDLDEDLSLDALARAYS